MKHENDSNLLLLARRRGRPCVKETDLFPMTARTEFCQPPGRTWKLISAPEPPHKNLVWLTLWFQAYDILQRTKYTLQEFWHTEPWSTKFVFIVSHYVCGNFFFFSSRKLIQLVSAPRCWLEWIDSELENVFPRWLTYMADKLVLIACGVCQMMLRAGGISSSPCGPLPYSRWLGSKSNHPKRTRKKVNANFMT